MIYKALQASGRRCEAGRNRTPMQGSMSRMELAAAFIGVFQKETNTKTWLDRASARNNKSSLQVTHTTQQRRGTHTIKTQEVRREGEGAWETSRAERGSKTEYKVHK